MFLLRLKQLDRLVETDLSGTIIQLKMLNIS